MTMRMKLNVCNIRILRRSRPNTANTETTHAVKTIDSIGSLAPSLCCKGMQEKEGA